MNHFDFTGRLTRDPEVKTLQSGVMVANFTVAVDRPGTSKDNRITDFFDCEVWGGKDGPGRAGVIQKWFHKGDGIVASGVMTTRKYQDKDGHNRTAYTVRVNDFEFPMGRKGDAGQGAPQEHPAPGQAGKPAEFTQVDDGDLPF